MLTTSSHVTHFCKAYLSLTIFQRVFVGHLNVKALHPVWWSVHSLEPHQIFAPIVHKKVKHRDMPNIPEVKPSAASLEVLACRVQALLPWGLAPAPYFPGLTTHSCLGSVCKAQESACP